MSSNDAVHATDLRRRYGEGEAAVDALAGVTIGFERGQYTAIMGPSGSGKSTLMHCLAGLDRPTEGEVFVEGTSLSGLDDGKLTELRRDKIGFIFQSFNLLPVLTAEENILLPLSIAGRKPDRAWVDQLIDTVGLRDRLSHRPAELSGGQQQRVAIARALVTRPAVIFADEPTATSTPRPRPSCWRSCAARSTSSARRSSWSPTTTMRRASPTASWCWRTAASTRTAAWTEGRPDAPPLAARGRRAQAARGADDLRRRARRRADRRHLCPHGHDQQVLRRHLPDGVEGHRRLDPRARRSPERQRQHRHDDPGILRAPRRAGARRSQG